MLITTTDTKKTYKITLRFWEEDNHQWGQDVAGEMLDTWAAGLYKPVQADVAYLRHEIDEFNAGKDLDWMVHCLNCQECLLVIEEVQEDD